MDISWYSVGSESCDVVNIVNLQNRKVQTVKVVAGKGGDELCDSEERY